jgi:D-sedoheptulose 7-phosphate isomerase
MDNTAVERSIKRALGAVENTFDQQHLLVINSIIETVVRALENGNKLLICGNGGSAADAQHIAAEFIGRFQKERVSYPAIALTTDSSIMTALGNDYGFDTIFSRQVEGLGSAEDVLIGISTSGNSANVLQAIEAAHAKGMVTIGFTGEGGGKMAARVDILFAANTSNTPDIQTTHMVALHTMCEIVETQLCRKSRSI